MLFESLHQGWFFLYALYGGIVLGLIYDIGRVIRYTFHDWKPLTLIIDLCYWAIGAVLVFLVLYVTTYGQIKVFILLGMLCGFILYLIGMSRFVIFIFIKVRAGIRFLLRRFKGSKAFKILEK